MHQIRFYICSIILFIFSISIFYGNENEEKKENGIFNYHNIKNDFSFLKDVLKYKSNIQEHDIKEGKSYLKGQASIEYYNIKIKADYIEFNWKNGDLYAQSKEKSVFFQKDNHQYTFSKIYLNINDQIGEAKNFYIKEKNHIIIANDFLKKKEDILMKKVIYISDPFFLKNQYSYPDFYLKTNYLKYSYSKKYVFSGPIFFYWYRVPMPIFLPFFYMPIKLNQSPYGLKYPKFGIQNKKIYMENIGLFFTISDLLNFRVNASMYDTEKEKWKVQTRIEYKLKYPYHGFIDLDYQNISSHKKNYLFQWKHNSDNKSNYEISFNANVNYDNAFLYKKNENLSSINIRKKLSDSLWFMDMYMIQSPSKKKVKFIIPELILHTKSVLFDDKKNLLTSHVNIENRFFLKNSMDFYYHKTTSFNAVLNHHMMINSYSSFFYPYLKISSQIFYKDFYTWNIPYFHISSYQKMDISTNIVSVPFYKIWKLKNNVLLKHEMEPILSFNMIYYPPVFYNAKNHLEKRINFILNNDLTIKTTWSHVNIYKKIEIFKEMNFSFIVDNNFIKCKNFYIMGNVDLTKNMEAKYKAGVNWEEEKKKNQSNILFDFSFFSNYNIHFLPVKNEYYKKGKDRYDYFLFDQKNYAKYTIPVTLEIDFHSNYENKKKLFQNLLSINGSINITKYWKVSFHTDYDFLKKKIIFSNLIFNRDLRSFEMSFNWNFEKSSYWSFFIGLKDPNFRNIIQYNERKN
ncbi:putative LPS assembly protein LptD [Blattabacterium cuenoti]|uniref:putative LPS assembly protein LptD n=1 Tax=Blattabacterium cuenoti TaxID=1653831 RepID=UPI001EEC0DCB|nr:putative LPS assembly protein LptD [Blattabacterium cuenoti]